MKTAEKIILSVLLDGFYLNLYVISQSSFSVFPSISIFGKKEILNGEVKYFALSTLSNIRKKHNSVNFGVRSFDKFCSV